MKRGEYYCEDEVERLINNLAQWSGDGAAVRSGSSIWGRLLREVRQGGAVVVTVGVDAGHAENALNAMIEELAVALVEYHVSPFPMDHQAKKLGIAQSTYRRRLELGHRVFMEAYRLSRSSVRLPSRNND